MCTAACATCVPSSCAWAEGGRGALLVYGAQAALPAPALDRTGYLLMIGTKPAVSGGSAMTAPGCRRRRRALRARGGRLVVLDPRRTETSRFTDAHHFIRPGTDALLLLAAAAGHAPYDPEYEVLAAQQSTPGGGRPRVPLLSRLAGAIARAARGAGLTAAEGAPSTGFWRIIPRWPGCPA